MDERVESGEMSRSVTRHENGRVMPRVGSFRSSAAAGPITWTQGLCRILDIDEGIVAPSLAAVAAALHGDDRDRFHDAVRRASTGTNTPSCEVRVMRQDGNVRRCSIELQPEIDGDGRVTALVGIVQDLTEEMRTEEALRQSQSLLRALIDAIPAAITVRDCDGRFVLVNTYEADYYGRPTEWFNGKVLADVYPADLAQRIAVRDRAVIATGRPLPVGQVEFNEPDGRTTIWLEQKAPICDDAGAVTHIVTIDVDITDRMQAEAELERNRVLLQAVIDAVPALISVTDMEGRYVLVNAASAAYHGHPADWFPGKLIEDVHRPEYAVIFRDRDQRALRGETPARPYEDVYTGTDGGISVWLAMDVAIRIGAGPPQYVVSVSLDVTELKQAESAAQESRNLLRTVIDAVPASIHVKDLDGRYILVNADMAADAGHPMDWIIGKRVGDLFPEEYARKSAERDRRLIALGEPTPLFEDEYVDRHGQLGTWLVRKVPLRDETGQVRHIVSVGLDITERKRAEAALHESQSLLRAIIDAIPATVSVKDLAGRYVLVNAHLAADVGHPIEWFGGKSIADVYPDDYVRKIQERDRLVIETGQTQRFYEIDYRDAAGAVSSWIGIRAPIQNVDGGIGYVVSVGLDITDRRRSELALEESERRFRHLVESTDVVPYSWDIDARRYLYLGPQIERILGIRPEALGDEADWLALVAPEDKGRLQQEAASFHASPRDHYREYRLVRPDGRVIWVRDVMKVERRDGHRIGFGFVLDITESKNRELQLAQAQKMEAVGKLTGGVAHDFNNLLTVILGSLELIELSMPKDPQNLTRVRLASEAAKRGSELTQRLLAFARQQMLVPRRVELNDHVAQMGELLRRTLGAGIAVRMQLASDLWSLRVDPAWLESTILNLAVNARDAMPNGGTLTIETANRQLSEATVVDGTEIAPGRYVALFVSDTGIGMTPEVVARAFDPFFTTKPTGKGTGLGLSMVYGFVKQSGGHIRIYSEVGVGTAVKIYLPTTDWTEAAGGEARDAHSDSPRGRETVLVAEDDESVRQTVVAMLQSLGYQVLTAADGMSALKILEAKGKIDLLLTDVIMPGKLNGPGLAGEAVKRRPTLRVLYMSGYTENAFGPDGAQSAEIDWLAKPFTKGDLARKVRRLLDVGNG
ncbi:MAG: PAS domain S-box protein [Dongiaceae bacterium]